MNTQINMENTLPPIGTKVYHIQFGWGKIKKIHVNHSYPIEVKFKDGCEVFTIDGSYEEHDINPTLSLTEYSLTEGGFMPISEWNKPKVGDVGYFWDGEELPLKFGLLTKIHTIDSVQGYCINDRNYWENFSKEIPEWYLKKIEVIKSTLTKP